MLKNSAGFANETATIGVMLRLRLHCQHSGQRLLRCFEFALKFFNPTHETPLIGTEVSCTAANIRSRRITHGNPY